MSRARPAPKLEPPRRYRLAPLSPHCSSRAFASSLRFGLGRKRTTGEGKHQQVDHLQLSSLSSTDASTRGPCRRALRDSPTRFGRARDGLEESHKRRKKSSTVQLQADLSKTTSKREGAIPDDKTQQPDLAVPPTQPAPQPQPAPQQQQQQQQQQQPPKPTQSFFSESNSLPLKRPAPPSAPPQGPILAPPPPPPPRRQGKRIPPRPFPSLFVSPPTPALWYLHSRVGEVLNAARLEGTRDESLQLASHQAVEAALAGLPTREQQVAMGLIMNRYTTFLSHPTISLPIYPITAPKVAFFLSRILPTPLGVQLLLLFPQPPTNPLPLANGVDRDLFPLGPGEGERVSAELVRCWVDALGFAQGVSAPIWRGLISLQSQRPVGGDQAVEEVCKGVESVRTMLPVVGEQSGGELGRRGAASGPEKKKAKWTKGGREVEGPAGAFKGSISPPRLNVSREISNARDLSPPALPSEMFGDAAQGSQQRTFGAGDLRNALSINGAPIPDHSSSFPAGQTSSSTPTSLSNGTQAPPPILTGPSNGSSNSQAEGLNLLVDSPTAISPTVSLSAAPPPVEGNNDTSTSVPPQTTTTATPRRSTRSRSTSLAAASPSAARQSSRRGSTSLAPPTAAQGSPPPLPPSAVNGVEKSPNVASRTRSRSISVGVGVGAIGAEGEVSRSPAAARRGGSRKSVAGGGGGGEGIPEGEGEGEGQTEREVESEIEAVRARKEGRAGQKRKRSSESLGVDVGEGKEGEMSEDTPASKESANANAEEQPLASTSSNGQQSVIATSDIPANPLPPLSNAEIEAALAAVGVSGLAPPPPPPVSEITPTPPPQQQHQRSYPSSLDVYSRPSAAAAAAGRGHPRHSLPMPLEIPRGLPGFSNGAASPSGWKHHHPQQHHYHQRQGFDPYASAGGGYAAPPPLGRSQSAYGAEYPYHSQAHQYLSSHVYPQASEQGWNGYPTSQQQQGYYARPPAQAYLSSHAHSYAHPPHSSSSSYYQHQPYSPHQPHPHPHPHQQYPPPPPSRSHHSPTTSASAGWPISSAPPPLSLAHSQSHISPPYPTPPTPYWSSSAAQQGLGLGDSAFGAGAGAATGGVPMMRGNGVPPSASSASSVAGVGMSGGGGPTLGGGGGGGGGGMGIEFGAGAGAASGGGGGGGMSTGSQSSRAGTPQQPGMTSGWHALD
ncbi:hypothetical protein BCR35DRAFT_316139 [Leucosporidium creatinivorum]|uniref:Uncharacterized protein n=1 Tax=Leucosporidium creatinivorum TaxID=106004 RepID=A0A1Y2D4E0_9BASI|nr:hypothetical protein BCR35DRAFT_316139 [Leucosporidium creatinivorum]